MKILLTILVLFTGFNFANARTTCYTNGVYDMFHIGHLNILRNAKGMCDILIVGVHTDETVQKYKNKIPVIPFEERIEVVRGIKYVDVVVPDVDHYVFDEKLYDKFKMDILIAGDDHLGEYDDVAKKLKKYGVKVVYLPYTKSQSSTKIRAKLVG